MSRMSGSTFVDGEYILEAGQERTTLRTGDSLLVPRRVPHAWASVGPTGGRLLVVFTPAGQMEAFFREVTPGNVMPGSNPELWRAYGMEWLGPPLAIG